VATVGPSPAGPASCDRRTPAAVTTAVVRHGVGPYRRGVATTEPDRSSRRGPGTNVVLLVAHGSRNPRAAPEHEELCARVARQASELAGEPVEVRPAYLEITEPSVPAAIDEAVAGGAATVVVVPHFLGSGNHVLEDLPALVAGARSRHPGVDVQLREHLGADPGLVDLLARRVLADG